MKELIKVNFEDKPPKFINLGTGYWYYNYNIQQEDEQYSCYQIRLNKKPNYKECVKQVIRLYLSQEEEFDIINSANRYLLGLDNNEKDVLKYKDYLNLLSQIKSNVALDFDIK